MVKFFLFLLLVVLSLISLITLIFSCIKLLIKLIRNEEHLILNKSIKKKLLILVSLILLTSIYCYITQVTASTPKIKDGSGKVIKNSIAELKKINLNGHDEWISIRGENKNAPIILFLAGGPGGTQMAATRYAFNELEKHFVIVNWDQPGSGKSFNCMKRSEIKVDTYINDGLELTKYLI